MVTTLTPLIGYDAAAAIAHEAVASGKTFREVARLKTALTPEQLETALEPWSMTMPEEKSGSKSARAKHFFFCYKPRIIHIPKGVLMSQRPQPYDK